MLKRSLGQSGRSVTAIGLGAMPLSLAGRPDEQTAVEVIRAFIEGGGDFIDTANVYCMNTTDVGHNERLVHKALEQIGRLHEVIIATKGGLTKEGSGWDADGRPEWLRRSCEQSLKDLRIDRIFLYQLHAPDSNVPFADSVGELARLRAEGKIEHIGLSNVNTMEIETALRIAPIVSVQNKLNVFMKRALRDGVVEVCRTRGIAFIAHSPAGGHRQQGRLAAAKDLAEIAAKYAATAYQVALAWLLQKGDHIIPIPGASRPGSATGSLAALDLRLGTEDMHRLDRLPDG